MSVLTLNKKPIDWAWKVAPAALLCDEETIKKSLMTLNKPIYIALKGTELGVSQVSTLQGEDVLAFASHAIKQIKQVSHNKIIILTIIEKRENKVYNFAKVFHNGEVVFERAKAKLFRFGDEHKYMEEGSDDNMQMVEIDGIKIAIFICFELRFKDFWQKIEGADVIAVPSYWGVLRTEHFKSITQTLAIINQCYVIASDSLDDECTKMSGIITPQGMVQRNNEKPSLTLPFSKKEVNLMRRYMDVGIG
jgi:predicted amidohydrolase